MLKLLCPDVYIDSIYDLDLDFLKKLNIKGILVDLDNTLAAWDQPDVCDHALNWVDTIRSQGFSICMVSNNRERRIRHYSQQLNMPAVWGHFKPSPGAFRKGMSLINTTPEETVVIGDQIFTDILGANTLGLLAVLVRPISNNEFFLTKLVRVIEKKVLNLLKRKQLIPNLHNQ